MEEADTAGLGRGEQDGAAAWPARTAARLLLPGGPRSAARCAGEQGEVPGGVAPPPRSASGGEGASPPGIGLAVGLGWPRPTLPVHFVDHALVLVVICPWHSLNLPQWATSQGLNARETNHS